MAKTKIFLIAGEVSGDLHGSLLVKELKRQNPELEFYGLGGTAMEREGVRIFFDLPSVAAIGLGDVLRQYFLFRKIFYGTLARVLDEIRPDLIILIDYPGFNIRFAKKINRRIPILYYISPQVWAWGHRRIKTIARFVSRMLVFLPFEVDVYKGSGLDCRFVGHPLIDLVKPTQDPRALRKEWDLNDKRVITLLPGSRPPEIRRILPVLLDAAGHLRREFPNAAFILAETTTVSPEIYEKIVAKCPLPLRRMKNRMYDAIAVSDVALVASGTATLETAISLKPFILVYKTAWSTYVLGRKLIRIPYIGLVNVLAGKKIVPEFIQQEATGELILKETARLLTDDQARQEMVEALRKVRESLGPGGAAARAADEVLDLIRALSRSS